MHKELGKITKVSFGRGGYQGCQFGLFLTLEFGGVGGCGACIVAGWDTATMECSKGCKWSEADRSRGHDELCRKISGILNDAKVDSVDQLRGKPIEAEFDSPYGSLKDWRILTEVI